MSDSQRWDQLAAALHNVGIPSRVTTRGHGAELTRSIDTMLPNGGSVEVIDERTPGGAWAGYSVTTIAPNGRRVGRPILTTSTREVAGLFTAARRA